MPVGNNLSAMIRALEEAGVRLSTDDVSVSVRLMITS